MTHMASTMQSASETQRPTQGEQRLFMHQVRGPQSASVVHGGRAHRPVPSHTNPAAHWLCGSGAPFGTGLQTPMVPGSAHEKHVWLQAVLQQAPCAQNPLLHSLFRLHGVRSLPPQVPLRQGRPLAQSSSLAQTVLQMPRATSQANGAQ